MPARRLIKTETVDGAPLLVDPLAVQAVTSSWCEKDGERIDMATLRMGGFCVVIRWHDFQRHFRDCFDIR